MLYMIKCYKNDGGAIDDHHPLQGLYAMHMKGLTNYKDCLIEANNYKDCI
jgi:hypothetical protein